MQFRYILHTQPLFVKEFLVFLLKKFIILLWTFPYKTDKILVITKGVTNHESSHPL